MKKLFVISALALVGLLNVNAGAEPGLRVDVNSYTQSQAFTLEGGSMDGIDAVHVWGFPNGQPVFLGWSWTDQPYVPTLTTSGGWKVLINRAPVGTYTIAVAAHNAATNTFPITWTGTFTIQACTGDTYPLLPWLGAGGVFYAPGAICAR